MRYRVLHFGDAVVVATTHHQTATGAVNRAIEWVSNTNHTYDDWCAEVQKMDKHGWHTVNIYG